MINERIIKSTNEPINQSINQSINQWINESTSQPETVLRFGRKLTSKYDSIVFVDSHQLANELINESINEGINQLDQRAVDATSINTFKSKLEGLRYTKMGFFMDQSA